MNSDNTIEATENFFLIYVREKHPANQFRWSKTQILSIREVVFLSYGIEPPEARNSLHVPFEQFLAQGDIYSIFNLTVNAIEAHTLRPTRDFNSVKAEDFVKWADDNSIPIRKEFFYQPDKESEAAFLTTNEKNRRPTGMSLRKEVARLAAQAYWKQEEKEISNPQSKLKKYTLPADLARKSSFNTLIEAFNNMAGLPPIKGSEYSDSCVDPEWFGDLYPGDQKPGPKPQIISK